MDNGLNRIGQMTYEQDNDAESLVALGGRNRRRRRPRGPTSRLMVDSSGEIL
jgi:hypothetical protein